MITKLLPLLDDKVATSMNLKLPFFFTKSPSSNTQLHGIYNHTHMHIINCVVTKNVWIWVNNRTTYTPMLISKLQNIIYNSFFSSGVIWRWRDGVTNSTKRRRRQFRLSCFSCNLESRKNRFFSEDQVKVIRFLLFSVCGYLLVHDLSKFKVNFGSYDIQSEAGMQFLQTWMVYFTLTFFAEILTDELVNCNFSADQDKTGKSIYCTTYSSLYTVHVGTIWV